MFLDPDPRGGKRQSQGSSPFFSAQTPIVSPRDEWRLKRKPLHERSPSQQNQQRVAKPVLLRKTSPKSRRTVRLVRPSPSPRSSLRKRSNSYSDDDFGKKQETAVSGLAQPTKSLSIDLKPTSAPEPGLSAASRVSDVQSSTNQVHNLDLPPNVTLLPSTSSQPVPKTAWHRRSVSSKYSTSSTLKGSEAANTSFVGSESSRAERLSQGTTLRGTPTPYEQEHSSLSLDEADDSGTIPQGPAQALQTLQEASPERPTIRAVLPSLKSSSSDLTRQLRSRSSDSSLPRPRSSHARSGSEGTPRTLRAGSSQGSASSPYFVRTYPSTPAPGSQSSQESLVQSVVAVPQTSSPNFVAFSHNSRPHSRSHLLHNTASIESIQSRLQTPINTRPGTGRSSATNNSWASHQRSSSADTLPPLTLPKKRLRHTRGSLSASASDNMDYEEIDTLPWPRQTFSSHLSTIASESDRSASQQLSHFSLGSGILTGDDSSSIPLSATVSRYRRESAPMISPASGSPPVPGTSSGDEAGDMTLGVFRAESAKPEPLVLRGRQLSAQDGPRRYDGPLPPIPPIPRSSHSDENFDTIGELGVPQLRQKRSGYSIRQRSNSTPSGSHSRHHSQVSTVDSERWSYGSSIFPTWAKNFYCGNAALMSASKISLNGPPTPRPRDATAINSGHVRTASHWTERSITSRLGTGYSEIESESPTSSHFLPSIFRPRTRTRAKSDASTKNKLRKSKNSRPSADDPSRPDSLAIFEAPVPQTDETLPSGQPKWGKLKDQSDAPPMPPLPRKYSKQKQWDNMTFPRPMTKDRLSEFAIDERPHLGRSKRQSNRLSTWRAPSFVESLDTLFNSRGNRQILLFALGFIFPFCWLLGALLPLPPRPSRDAAEAEKALGTTGSEEDVEAVLRRHEAGDASKRWSEERVWMKARWWRTLNRIMCFVGVGLIAAVIALAIVATR